MFEASNIFSLTFAVTLYQHIHPQLYGLDSECPRVLLYKFLLLQCLFLYKHFRINPQRGGKKRKNYLLTSVTFIWDSQVSVSLSYCPI